jgi:hypothetical protein
MMGYIRCACAILLFAFIGCTTSKGKEDGSSITPENAAATLIGTWKTNCVPYKTSTHPNNSIIATYEYSSTSLKTRIQYFSQPNCTQHRQDIIIDSTYTLGNKIAGNTYAIDLKTQNTGYIFVDDALIQQANQAGDCGYKDWQKGVLKNVTNRSCSTMADKIYSIVEINLTSIRTGDSGNEGDLGHAPDKRIHQLGQHSAYKVE